MYASAKLDGIRFLIVNGQILSRKTLPFKLHIAERF